MTQTPPTVTDELSATLVEALGPAALVELNTFIALTNFMTRSDTACREPSGGGGPVRAGVPDDLHRVDLVVGLRDGGTGGAELMPHPICRTCGVQYGAPRSDCPICLDERQYVAWAGQRWTSLEALRSEGFRGRVAEEGPAVFGIGREPTFAIGQRALLLRSETGNVLWDCITYLDDDLVATVNELGGVSAIAISHPH
jgi:hypothetical protein